MATRVGETARAAEPEGALARPVLRRVLAAVVVVAWLAWAVPSWMSSLQEVRAHEVVADAKAGRVTGFQAVENVRPHTMQFGALGTTWDADGPAADASGRPTDVPPRQLVYSLEGSTRTRWVPDLYVGMPDGPEIFTLLAEAGARPYTPQTYPPNRDWASYPALVAFAVAAFAWVTLPPRRGTRAFWFLTATVGAGLGIVAYAVSELWWRRSFMPGMQDEAGERDEAGDTVEHRLRWFHGLGVWVVGGLVVAALRAVIT